MSQQRLKRLQRLEARRPSERPWTDPGPVAIALLRWHLDCYAAVEAGRACPLASGLSPHPLLRPADQPNPRQQRPYPRLARGAAHPD
jgi:hypothetical protein